MNGSSPATPAGGRGWQIALVVASLLLVFRISATTNGLWVDLDVYIAGGRAVLEGRPLYDVEAAGLPFTYPPFAAVLFVPLAVLPVDLTRLVVTALSVASLVLVARIVGRQAGMAWLPVVVVMIASLGAEPVVRNLILGQINILLMLMVVLDLFVLPARWRGVLIGIATGIKLVPGAFVLLYVLRRDLSAVGRATVAVVVTVIIGFAQPAASRSFWSGGLWDLGVGDTVVRADNQSLAGLAMRLSGHPDLASALQLVLTVGVLGFGLLCAYRVRGHRLGAPLQMALIAVAALLASPVSWTHHWVWMVPVALVLIALRTWVLLGAIAVVFWIGLVWLGVPADGHVDLGWSGQLLASLYLVLGVASMIVMTRRGSERSEAVPRVRAVQP